MKTLLRHSLVALMAGGGLLAGACASKPEPSGGANIMLGTDGSFQVLDADGRPSNDPLLLALAQSLSEAMAEETAGPTLREDQILREDSDGHLTHLQSGAICAASIAGIARSQTQVYAPDGSDIGCSYDGGSVAVTLYVYRRESTLQDELAEALSAMRERQPVSTDAPFFMDMPGVLTHTLAYKRADGTDYRTSVLVTEVSGWKLKVRVTNPTSRAADMEYRAGIALMGQHDRLSTSRSTQAPPANPT